MAVAYQRKTLRQMSPTTRKVARLTGEALSVGRRFKNLVPEIQRLETDSRALANAKQADRFGFSPEEWRDISNAIENLLNEGSITVYQGSLLQRLVDKLRK